MAMASSGSNRGANPDWHRAFFELERATAERHQGRNNNGVGGLFSQATKAENRGRNRWHNVLPYDGHRVALQKVDEGQSDYINASMVKGPMDRQRRYILTQGPLEATLEHFWSMIWEQNVRVLVMLCKTRENCMDKCHQYWPAETDQEVEVSSPRKLKILLLSEDLSHPDYIRRELLVESQPDSEPEDVPRPSRSRSRRVTHFQFVTWPDFGVPEGPSGVLALLEAAQAARDEAADDDHHDGDTTEQREESSPSEQNSVECHNVSSSKSPTSLLNRVKKKLEEDDGKKNKESDHPILVHCSAGIGRSGTFVLIDQCDSLLKRNKKKSISAKEMCEVLADLRKFRPGLVQTPQQLEFSYQAVCELTRRMQVGSQKSPKAGEKSPQITTTASANGERGKRSLNDGEGDEDEKEAEGKDDDDDMAGGSSKRRKSGEHHHHHHDHKCSPS